MLVLAARQYVASHIAALRTGLRNAPPPPVRTVRSKLRLTETQ